MPQSLSIPFYVFKLHLQDGDTITVPLTDDDALFLKKPIKQLANQYQEQFQKKVIDKGNYQSILNGIEDGQFSKEQIEVSFPASKDALKHAEFSLFFDYFLKETDQYHWGIVPALGIEGIADSKIELENRLQEAVKVDFSSRKRLSHIQHVISSLWFKDISLEIASIEMYCHTPAELADVQKEEKKKLLPKVATKLELKKQVVYGRVEELKQIERILESNFSKNILLIGNAGSGKTALVWEMAYRWRKKKKPNYIWETTASVMIKELTLDTGWQDSLSALVKELTINGDFLFVRNLSELFEVGQYEGNAVSMAEYLRPYIARGELTLLTECTKEERARIEVKSPNFLSFFQTIQLEEPKSGLDSIIRKKVEDMAGARKVKFEQDAIDEVIGLHRRFSPYAGMPGKPIRFLESVLLSIAPSADPPKAGKEKKKKASTKTAAKDLVHVSRQAVLEQYCNESGMPAFMVDPALPMDVDKIKQQFNQQVFGQQKAVDHVVELMAAVKTALTRTGKPIASFLFVGPTGVGKTELAKVLSHFMFGSRDRLLRFDMSEFSDPYSILRLTGQGYFNDGLLTSAVRREPFCVLLFDEIEKADNTFYDLLLQIIGEGRLTDSQGKLVNFCSAIIIMTSNIGAAKLQSGRIGWKKEMDTVEVTDHFIKEVEKNFKPELFNRIDSVVAFEPLSRETVRAVVEREIKLFKKREGIQFRRLDFTMAPAVFDYLSIKGYDPKFGARYLQRTIRERLITPMAYTLNQYDHDDQILVKAVVEEDKIVLQTSSDPLAFDLLMEQWDKLTLADQASQLRRKMMMMQEGPVYMRMQSELDIMESDKKLDDTNFWKDLQRSDLYTKLLNARAHTGGLYEKIKHFEIEISLAAMEQGNFHTDFESRVEDWETAYHELLIQIYSLLFPENNHCYLSIYGASFEALTDFYLDVIRHKHYDIKYAQAIWYREGFQGIDDDNDFLKKEDKVSSPYIKRKLSIDELHDHLYLPPSAEDRLYGIEFCVQGPAAAIYFNKENGLQSWEIIAKEAHQVFKVAALNKYEPTPSNIFRQSFYQKPKPRRVVYQTAFTDTPLNMQAQVKQKDLAKHYTEQLDSLFRLEMEQFFF